MEITRRTYGLHLDNTPYAGKTVLTGTNSAVVEFHEDQGGPYGTIQLDDEEPERYDSIEDMIQYFGGSV